MSQHNLTQLRRLAKSAREEMARQEVRNRLAEADREVLRCQIGIWKGKRSMSLQTFWIALELFIFRCVRLTRRLLPQGARRNLQARRRRRCLLKYSYPE